MLDDPTFWWRAPAGVALLGALALRDRARTGRWRLGRELVVVFGAAGVAVVYAVVHDAITWSVSPDYFVVGKAMPEAAHAFAPVARVGAMAGWSVGLGAGLALVIANHPHATRPQLDLGAIARVLAIVPVLALIGAALGAALGPALGASEVSALASAGVHDANAYLVVQGVHLGSYAGAALGTLLAIAALRTRRSRLTSA